MVNEFTKNELVSKMTNMSRCRNRNLDASDSHNFIKTTASTKSRKDSTMKLNTDPSVTSTKASNLGLMR